MSKFGNIRPEDIHGRLLGVFIPYQSGRRQFIWGGGSREIE